MEQVKEHDKPRRRYTKLRSDIVILFCMLVVIYTIVFKSESKIASDALSYSFLTIAAVLGIYQGTGAFDFYTHKKSSK